MHNVPYVWAQDRRNRAEHLIRRALVALSEEVRERAASAPAKKERDRAYKAARALQSRGALTKAMPELQAHPKLTLTVEDFDADDWLLNTPDGIIDLRTGTMSDPDPAALMSKSTAVAPGGECPRWLQFIEEVTGGDSDLADYLQRLIGYALTGSTQEQVLAFIHGPPLTGKSVFVDTIGGLFGSYHENAPADTFAAAKSDRHPTDIAKLAGSRLVTAVETKEGRSWDTQRIKVLTGGDQVSARFMRQDFFTYKPRYQIIIVGNHEPEIRGVDDALMRRLHVIPFEHRPEEIDRLLGEKLKAEWPGILSWAIDGCLRWLDEGLEPPECVRQRTEEYRHEEDPVGLFIEEMCELTPEGEITRRELYRAWQRWCHQQGEDPGSLKSLKRRFRQKQQELGFTDHRILDARKRRRGYKGIRLVDDTAEEEFEV